MKPRVVLTFVIIFLIINIICITYTELFNNNKDLPVHEKIIDGIYFTTTTFSSVGYGDISPIHPASKLIVSLQQLFLLSITVDAFMTYAPKLT